MVSWGLSQPEKTPGDELRLPAHLAGRLEHAVQLADITTIRTGGPAAAFLELESETEVLAVVKVVAESDWPALVIGGGSNLVVADAGFNGLVVRLTNIGVLKTEISGEDLRLSVAAGESWDEFVDFCVASNLAGVECLAGIPGRVGATPIQNVGAYGQSVSDVIEAVRAVDTQTFEVVEIPGDCCAFGHRTSRFRDSDYGRYIITRVVFRLRHQRKNRVAYDDVAERILQLGGRPEAADLSLTTQAVRDVRARKSMLIDATDPNSSSVGSFFVNPVLSKRDASVLVARLAREASINVRTWPEDDGLTKLPAAALIEAAGFARGHLRGCAGISTKHVLAIVNTGGATTAEIVGLAAEIQQAVAERFGIVLNPEPTLVGVELPLRAQETSRTSRDHEFD